MIISVEKLKNVYNLFKDENDIVLKTKLDGIESSIRLYTNNNFQNRNVRINCPCMNNYLVGTSPYLKVGDTVQISNSNYNDGLYVIETISSEKIKLDKDLYDVDNCIVTKIEYPDVVLSVVLDILKWEQENGSKLGIASESIGRHSVSYVSQNDSNSIGKYPLHLFNPLNRFKMASRRFN